MTLCCQGTPTLKPQEDYLSALQPLSLNLLRYSKTEVKTGEALS